MRVRLLFLFALLLLLGIMSSLTFPTTAQNIPNLVTNTPQPTLALPVAPFEQYALRAWQESDFLLMVDDALNRLVAGQSGAQNAVRLLLYEMAQRFPTAPSDLDERERLIQTMLNAPRGSVDMRGIVRPYFEALLNEEQPDLTERGVISGAGFAIEIFPANLDGDARPDAVLHSVARGVLYEDYTLVTLDEQGIYRVLQSVPSLPSAPLDNVQSIFLERVEDVTGDSVDEIVLLTRTESVVNAVQMWIYGVRGQQAVSLVEQGSDIRFGELLNFPSETRVVTALDHRLESPAWSCIGEQPVRWAWSGNLYRPAAIENNTGYVQQNNLACALYQLEPIFSLPPTEALRAVQDTVAQFPFSDPAIDRAAMVLIMLDELAGDREGALAQAQQLVTRAAVEGNIWLETEAQAYIDAVADADATSLEVCAAVQTAVEYGACSVDQVLERLFTENPLRRDTPIVEQLEDRGLQVLETTEIVEAGRAPRTAVSFDLAASSWWAFAPTTRDAYTAERLAVPPPGFEVAAPRPSQITPTPNLYDALINRNDIAGALAILDNLGRTNVGVPLSPEALYVRALGYDLLFDRNNARQAYFDLWTAYPSTVWGQLAAAHLELR
jgi:hypothetical protein